MNALIEKVRQAADRLKSSHCQILTPGEYHFGVLEARSEYDDQRKYEYIYVRLDCGGTLTSDRFPITDNMLWKLGEFLSAVGLDVDSWSELKELVGRKGKLTATKDGSATYYRYLAVVSGEELTCH